MNDHLLSRLFNGKFRQAEQYLDKEPEHVRELIRALHRSYGDPGTVIAMEGDQGIIVRAALESIGAVFRED